MTLHKLPLDRIPDELLPCLALRHRWIAHAALARREVIGGARVWDWELRCTGCDSSAFEMRDNWDIRIPGTVRTYGLSEEYSRCTGYSQDQYLTQIRTRGLFHKLRIAN